jgi:threonine aldolase
LNEILDFRSDASSLPTEAIRRAMADAEVGNDDFGDDPTVNRLEEKGAQLLGKEAALFVHSGTMANMAAVMSHVDAGAAILSGERFHIYDHEGDAMRRVAGVEFALVGDRTRKGRTRLLIEEFEVGGPEPRLLCLENSVNRPGGTLIEMEHMRELAEWASERGMSVHLDGARLFNACIELGVEPGEWASCVDSVALGLTKGLAAPCGALLAGDGELIEKARHNRWMLGGNWKQGGVVAAACIVALDTMRERMAGDHENARRLARGLDSIEGLAVDLDQVVTNILYMRVTDEKLDLELWSKYLARHGVLTGGFQAGRYCRWVTHHGIGVNDVDRAVQIVADAFQQARTR